MVDAPYPNRLQECMARAELNDPQLAEAVGTTRQQIHKLRHGERKLTVEWAKRLAPILEVSWQELITGSPPDPAERELVGAYRSADDMGREMLLRFARALRPDQDGGFVSPGARPPNSPSPSNNPRRGPHQ
jgi:transcriptional regulator with XRE-family HTH domain